MIRTHDVTKRYGSVLAVDRVDLDVREGDRYGLLGPNGSGKTTLIRLLLGLVFATSGEIEVLGHEIPRYASRALADIGAIVEGPAGYPHLSGRTNLRLLDAAGPASERRGRRRRVDDALARVGLGGIDARPLRAYSLGMRARLAIAAALLVPPRLLVLDEPTNGLDPRGIRDVRDLLIELNQAGVTLFVSSHLLGEVEQLCSRVGVMDDGQLILQDDLETLRTPTGRIIVDTPDASSAAALLDGRVDHTSGQRLLVRGSDAAALNAELVSAGVRVAALAAERRTLEQVVLAATGLGSDRIEAPMRAGFMPIDDAPDEPSTPGHRP